MKGLWIAVATCVLVSCSAKGNHWWEDFEERKWQRNHQVLDKEGEEETQAAAFNRSFSCPDMSPSPSVPSSVEFVKAADIKVIAALGDSLTTAVGVNATSVLQIPIEFRDLSWSIGGYGTFQDVITLPNIIKFFNPNLLGASTGKTIHGMDAHINYTGFNLAVAGQNTFNLPEQTRALIDTMRSYKGLNFKEDWKLLTILMGMNDICDYCKDKTRFTADKFIHHFAISLEMLMNEVPRMIVNVVQIASMQTLREVKSLTPGCFLQRTFCSCLVEPSSKSPKLQELLKVNQDYQERLEELLYSDRFYKEDFAVVLQPFLKHVDLPRRPNGRPDMSFFAPDCFHLTMKGQEKMAIGLWNNMFQPPGEKLIMRKLSDPITLICPPVEHPYIYTRPVVVKPARVQRSCGAPFLTFTTLLLFFHMSVAHFLFC